MKKYRLLTIVALFVFVMVSFATAQTTVQISTQKQEGKWTAWRQLTVTFEQTGDGGLVVYAEDELLDHSCYTKKAKQEWYCEAVETGWNKFTFSAKTENIRGEYAVRCSFDEIEWTAPGVKYYDKAKSPRSPS